MKTLAALSLLALAALPLAALERSPTSECAALLAAVTDEPPPVDCPMCGGNPITHRMRLRAMVYAQASLSIWRMGTTVHWRGRGS